MRFSDLLSRTGLVAAHRGNRAIRPENTLSAFRNSIGTCDFIELDVQLSRDGVVVVIHDDTLDRTTDIADRAEFENRRPWRVSDLTLYEIKRLDAGSWFYREDPFGTIAKGDTVGDIQLETIPTLEETLRFAREYDQMLNIEIKDMRGRFDDQTVLESVVGMIEAQGCSDRVLLSSFYHGYMKSAKQIAPHIVASALQEGEHPEDLIDYLQQLGVDGYHCDDAIISESVVKELRKNGFFAGVYTVNDPLRQKELFEWGVNAVFTDVPSKAVKSIS